MSRDEASGGAGGPVRVIVADTTRMSTQLILQALRRDKRFDAVAGLAAPEEFDAAVSHFKPEVAVIGTGTEGRARNGLDLLRHIQVRYPELQAVMLLDSPTHEVVVEAFRAGARGVICRDDGLDALRKCVYAVHLGQIWATNDQLGFVLEAFSRRWVPQTIVDSNGHGLLSKRELDVVRCVSEGMTNRQIASHLALSEHTVKNYIFRTFDKLGVSNRSELILYAINHGHTPGLDPCPFHRPCQGEQCTMAARIEAPVSPAEPGQRIYRTGHGVGIGNGTLGRPRPVQ